ncbi:MAG: heparinase II/III-family protein [Treponema sp.]|nr:heparinase II/III-family protein [Treponema sp.]
MLDSRLLLEALQCGSGEGASGSGLFSRVCGGVDAETIERNPRLEGFLAYLKKESGRFRHEAIPPLPYSLFVLFDSLGDRKQFEDPYFERRSRLMVYGLSSWLWKKPEDIAGLEDSIWAICDEYSWCLPAHMGGRSRSPAAGAASSLGIVTDARFDNALTIDLFACETGLALAECCAALEGALAPQVLERARNEAYRRLIKSYLEYGAFQHWELLKMNWCSVCGGGLGATACYLIQDDRMLGGVLYKLLPTLDRFLNSFTKDGACVEGLSYWSYGVSYFVMFADILFHRTGGAIDLLKDSRFEKIARFQQKCYLPGGAPVYFSDAENSGFRMGLADFLSRRVPGVTAPPQDRAMRMERDNNGHFNHALRDFSQSLRDLIWTESHEPPPFKAEPLVVLPDAQWLIASTGETAFAAKGGHNDEPHNHNDVGSFIYYKKGKMAICDLGSGQYTKDYFNESRYTIFCNQSFSHSVPIINGGGQKPGGEYGARDCSIGPGAKMVLDMAGAYGADGLLSLKRRFVFDPVSGGLRIEDRFLFSPAPLPLIERFVSLFPPRIEGRLARIDAGDSQTVLSCSLETAPVIHEQKHRGHDGNEIAVYLIDFALSPETAEVSIMFELQ